MKIVPLAEMICGFDGKGILVDGRPLVTRDLLLQYVGTFESERGSDLILARKVGQKIYDAKGLFVELEESEWAIIKRAVSRPKHIALFMGGFLEYMEKVVRNEFEIVKTNPKDSVLNNFQSEVKVTGSKEN